MIILLINPPSNIKLDLKMKIYQSALMSPFLTKVRKIFNQSVQRDFFWRFPQMVLCQNLRMLHFAACIFSSKCTSFIDVSWTRLSTFEKMCLCIWIRLYIFVATQCYGRTTFFPNNYIKLDHFEQIFVVFDAFFRRFWKIEI